MFFRNVSLSLLLAAGLSACSVNLDPQKTSELTVTTQEDTAIEFTLPLNQNAEGKTALKIRNLFSLVSKKGNFELLDSAGHARYTPNLNENGEDEIEVPVDSEGNKGAILVKVAIEPVNDSPIAENAAFEISENGSVNGSAKASDIEGEALSFSLVRNGNLGSVILDSSTGAFEYTPNLNANGNDSFTFRVSDGIAISNIATVSISIAAVNTAPVASNSFPATNEDSPLNGTLSGLDPDGSSLTYSLVSNGSKGTAVITNASTGTFSYAPNLNANGTDLFTFKVNDGVFDSNVAMVTVTINPVNDLPVAFGGTINTPEDTPATVTLNSTDVDGDPLTYSIVAQPSKGTISGIFPNFGSFTYRPLPNATGADSFTFKANDGKSNSNTATVSVNIGATNDAPVASNRSFSINEDSTYSGNLSASDPESDPLFFSVVTPPLKGAVNLNPATGSFQYIPNPNENGSDSFTFKAQDGSATSNTATVTITINPRNDAPIAQHGLFSFVIEDLPASGMLLATDVDSTTLSYFLVAQGTKGVVALANNTSGAFTYTPKPNATGSDTFTFHVYDGFLFSNTGTIAVVINPVNDAPVAQDGSLSTNEDTSAAGTLKATDIDNSTLNFSIVTQGTKGIVGITNSATGAFTYTPNSNANGTDSFTFRASDGSLNSNTATITVSIGPVNDAPTPQSGSLSTNEDVPVTGTLGATDSDSASLTFSIVAQGTKGVVSITNSSTGTFTYTPIPNANGADSFTFKANDGAQDSTTATISVNISPVGDAPIVPNQTVYLSSGGSVSVALTANDPDGDTLQYVILTQPTYGQLAGTPPALSYKGESWYHGKDSFTYKVSDGTNESVGTVTLDSLSGATGVCTLGELRFKATSSGPTSIALLCDIDAGGEYLDIWNRSSVFYSGDHVFSGTFYGNKHTISNFRIYSSSAWGALFPVLSSGSQIRNLNLTNVVGEGTEIVSALVGYLQDGAIVSGVNVSATLKNTASARGYLGGIAGWAVGTIEDSSANVTINVTSSSASGKFGGAVGFAARGARNVHVRGSINVSGPGSVGGLAGESRLSITDSSFNGNVTASAAQLATTNVGGLVGFLNIGAFQAKVSKSFALGTIASSQAAGGLVGKLSGRFFIENSSADVNVTGSRAGGLVGDADLLGVLESFSLGTVRGTTSGGLIGYATSSSGDNVLIRDSYSSASVTGTAPAGSGSSAGLVGGSSNILISNCYSVGHVTGVSSAGIAYSTPVFNSYWNLETSGQPYNSTGGKGLTTAEMQMEPSCHHDWNFVDVWSLDASASYAYPTLRRTPKPVAQ